MPATRTVLVCLPPNTHPRHLADLAITRLALHGLTAIGAMPHFVPGTRRSSKLLDRWRDTAAGGPIALLDLESMRLRAQASAATRWLVWRDVVADTPAAKPFWVYASQHRRDGLTQVRSDFFTQPRVQAMEIYNALPNRLCDLPPADLEALQAGHPTYAWLGYLTAVPADGVATAHGAHGGWLARTAGPLTDQLDYLKAANAHLAWLHPNVNVVAMAAR